MKKLTNNEKVLQYLITKNHKSIDNKVDINKFDVKSLELTEDEVINAIKFLNIDNYIRIITKGRLDFTVFWKLELTSDGIHYFEAKKETKKEKRNKWIQFWIPVSVSIVALGIAGLSLLLELSRSK